MSVFQMTQLKYIFYVLITQKHLRKECVFKYLLQEPRGICIVNIFMENSNHYEIDT